MVEEDALTELRARAEASLRADADASVDPVIGRTLEEHEVQRAELEIQNEELRRTKLELELALDRYRTLFERAPVGLLTASLDGVVRTANPVALHLFGVSAGRMEGVSLVDLASHEHESRLHRHFDRLVSVKDRSRLDLELRARGSGRALRLRGRLQDDHGRLEVVMVVTDVTSLRTTEAALAGERDLTARLLDSLPLVAVVLDRRGRIVRLNRWLDNLSSRPAGAAVGSDWFETYVPPRAREATREAYEDALAGLPSHGLVSPLVTPDGDERLMEWHKTPLTEPDGSVNAVLVVGLDVTRARRLEEAARHAQKMEAVGTLAAGVAHDFNNLLMGMVGVLDLAIGRIHGDEQVRSLLQMIRDRAKAGMATVSQLMAFSRRDSVEQVERVVEDAVRETEVMLGMLLGADIRLETDLDAPGARVRLDEGQMEQILTNLAANARHAMPRGGTVSIRTSLSYLDTPPDECGELPRGEYVCLEVADTGVGMDDATRRRAFEPFFTTKPLGEGTGLGLSTVYGIVKRAGGCVQLSSAPGVGTTFRVLLPRTRESQARIALPPTELRLATGQMVLLVEDAPMVRMTVRGFLEAAGYQVIEAGDAQEALELWRRHQQEIALLVSDVVLPGLQGPELGRRLKQDVPDLPVVWMSAHSKVSLGAEGHLDPSATLLTKPFGAVELRAAVAHALGENGRRRAPPSSS